ncbi:MAG: oligosaccharide flippase family protein [Crocinitomix sp.]|nr:oligosaccharide flippase family protein [Crocinitomix sp.]
MQKKFLSNLLLIVVLNLLVKPFYILGIDAEVQNRVGEAVYGNYFSLLNFSFLLNILLDLGLTNYNARNIAQHPQQISNHFGKILAIRFSLFFLYAVATIIFAGIIGYTGQEFYLLGLLMVNQFLVAIVQFSRSNFAGLHLFKTDAIISILDRTLLIGICSALLWTDWFGGEMKIEWFIYAQTVAYGTSALIAVVLLLIKIGKVRLSIKKPFTLYILRQSFPYALLILLMMMYNRIDAVMLERLLPNGDAAAGIYAQGFRLLDAVNMFALLFAGLLLPIFARLLRKKESIDQMTALAFRMLFGISIIVGTTCFFFQTELIELRYEGSSTESAVSFGFLILSFIPVAITYVFGTLLTANGSLRYLNQMAFAGVIMNVLMNYFFIQSMGVVGAALATLITQGVTAIVQMVVAYRLFKFKFSFKYYASFIGLVGGLLGAYYFLNVTFTNRLELIIPYFIFGVVLGFLLGIFRISDLKTIVVKEET